MSSRRDKWSSAAAQAALLYVDAHVIVLNKPAGLAVHPGPKTPDSLEDWLDDLRLGFRVPPYPAHRLDRDTSGCLILGRHAKALKRLGQAFSAGEIGKTYWAWVVGRPQTDEGVINQPLSKRSTAAEGWRMVADPKGQAAVTAWRVIGESSEQTLLELTPRTGRTHQLRVHLAAIGCPIVGDPLYGVEIPDRTMLLHARSLQWRLPETAPPHLVEAPVPGDWPPSPIDPV